MPVSMMMPIAGSSPKVSGNSSVIPASGPSPGNTPTMVPQKHPMKQYNSPFHDSATANPPSSWSKPVIAPTRSKRPGRKLQPERNLEEIPASRHADCGREARDNKRTPGDEHKKHCPEQSQRHIGAKRFEQQRHCQESGQHNQHVAMPEFNRFLVSRVKPISNADHDGKHKHQYAKDQRKESGTRQRKISEIDQRGLPREEQANKGERRGDADAAAPGADRAEQTLSCLGARPQRIIQIASHSEFLSTRNFNPSPAVIPGLGRRPRARNP